MLSPDIAPPSLYFHFFIRQNGNNALRRLTLRARRYILLSLIMTAEQCWIMLNVCHFYFFPGTAVGKLLTLGGVGIWWIVDIVLLVTGVLRPEDGSNWEPFY